MSIEDKQVQEIVSLGFGAGFSISLQFKNQNDYATERLNKIIGLIESKTLHTLQVVQFWGDMSGQPASEIDYFNYVFNGERYIESETASSETIEIISELY